MIFGKCLYLGHSERLIAMYDQAAALLRKQRSIVAIMITDEDIFVLILFINFLGEEEAEVGKMRHTEWNWKTLRVVVLLSKKNKTYRRNQ